MNNNMIHKKALEKKRKRKIKELKKYFADSKLSPWEQKKRVEWHTFHDRDIPSRDEIDRLSRKIKR